MVQKRCRNGSQICEWFEQQAQPIESLGERVGAMSPVWKIGTGMNCQELPGFVRFLPLFTLI